MTNQNPERLLAEYYVEYPPGGLWVGDCEIYPQSPDEYATAHVCTEHVILVAWGWADTIPRKRSNHDH